jgi:hypothetical protein
MSLKSGSTFKDVSNLKASLIRNNLVTRKDLVKLYKIPNRAAKLKLSTDDPLNT